jgi:hypothetical protein
MVLELQDAYKRRNISFRKVLRSLAISHIDSIHRMVYCRFCIGLQVAVIFFIMDLSAQDGLDVAQVSICVPALGLHIWFLLMHGFGTEQEWMYPAILSFADTVDVFTWLATITNNCVALV